MAAPYSKMDLPQALDRLGLQLAGAGGLEEAGQSASLSYEAYHQAVDDLYENTDWTVTEKTPPPVGAGPEWHAAAARGNMSWVGATTTLLASMLGVGCMSIPGSMAWSGLVFGLAIVLILAVGSGLSAEYIAMCGRVTNRDSIHDIAKACCGWYGPLLTYSSLFLCCYFAAVAYLCVMYVFVAPTMVKLGLIGEAAAETGMASLVIWSPRTLMILIFGCASYGMALIPNMRALSFASYGSLIVYVLMTLIVVIVFLTTYCCENQKQWIDDNVTGRAKWHIEGDPFFEHSANAVVLDRTEAVKQAIRRNHPCFDTFNGEDRYDHPWGFGSIMGIFLSLAVLCNAFCFHFSVTETFRVEMEKPTRKRVKSSIWTATGVGTFIYVLIAVLGFLYTEKAEKYARFMDSGDALVPRDGETFVARLDDLEDIKCTQGSTGVLISAWDPDSGWTIFCQLGIFSVLFLTFPFFIRALEAVFFFVFSKICKKRKKTTPLTQTGETTPLTQSEAPKLAEEETAEGITQAQRTIYCALIVFLIMAWALVNPNFNMVVTLAGGLGGSVLLFVMPALMMLGLRKNLVAGDKAGVPKLGPILVLCLGVLILSIAVWIPFAAKDLSNNQQSVALARDSEKRQTWWSVSPNDGDNNGSSGWVVRAHREVQPLQKAKMWEVLDRAERLSTKWNEDRHDSSKMESYAPEAFSPEQRAEDARELSWLQEKLRGVDMPVTFDDQWQQGSHDFPFQI